MAKVVLASQLARWLPATSGDAAATLEVPGDTLGDALDALFGQYPRLRGYVLDEQGAVRRHVAIFVDGNAIHHHGNLHQALGEHAEIHLMQALSGG